MTDEMLELLPALMRKHGIRRLRMADGFEVELADTIPAPPAFEVADAPEEQKLPSQCIAAGCYETNGWQFDSRYCAPHGRAAAGVKP